MPKRKRPISDSDSDEGSSSDDGGLFTKMFSKNVENDSKEKSETKQNNKRKDVYEISDSDDDDYDNLPPVFDAVKPRLQKLNSKLAQFSKKSEDKSKAQKCICKTT